MLAYIYIYTYIYTYVYTCVYYIYVERKREGEREMDGWQPPFHVKEKENEGWAHPFLLLMC